jgi:hypothetical protein
MIISTTKDRLLHLPVKVDQEPLSHLLYQLIFDAVTAEFEAKKAQRVRAIPRSGPSPSDREQPVPGSSQTVLTLLEPFRRRIPQQFAKKNFYFKFQSFNGIVGGLVRL